jgi:hypothetical protein
MPFPLRPDSATLTVTIGGQSSDAKTITITS